MFSAIKKYPAFQRLKSLAAAMRTWFSAWIFCQGKAYLFERRLAAKGPAFPGEISRLEPYAFREATEADLPQCAALADLTLDEARRRYDFGDRCFGVFAEGRLVNVLWLHFGSCYVRGLGLCLELEGNDVYLYGVFTDPAHRGRGLYRLSLEEITARMSARGMSRILQVVEEGNPAPLHTLPKLGHELVGIIHHFTIFHFKKTSMFCADGRRIISNMRWRKPADVFWI
jgi:GNAT superfamily N-acetyltransferase